MLTICLLILIGLYLRKPVEGLVERLKNVDWSRKFTSLWQHIQPYAKKAGRATAKPILQFYYVVTDSETSTLEKALIYGCIAYVVLPFFHVLFIGSSESWMRQPPYYSCIPKSRTK